MVAMVPLLTPVSGYYTTFYNHIAMVLTPLRDLGKTMAEPHSILQGKCYGTVKYAFPGGIYKNKLSIFEELEEMGVRVKEDDKYEKWFACFDFEAYQRDFREGLDQVEEIECEPL